MAFIYIDKNCCFHNKLFDAWRQLQSYGRFFSKSFPMHVLPKSTRPNTVDHVACNRDMKQGRVGVSTLHRKYAARAKRMFVHARRATLRLWVSLLNLHCTNSSQVNFMQLVVETILFLPAIEWGTRPSRTVLATWPCTMRLRPSRVSPPQTQGTPQGTQKSNQERELIFDPFCRTYETWSPGWQTTEN